MNKKILIIEDEVGLQTSLVASLKGLGLEPVSVFNGEDGLKALQSDPSFDLVVLDLILPKKHGIEVLEEMRKNPKTRDIPVAILTNIEDAKMIQRAFELGVAAYLVKVNYDVKDIAERLLKLLSA